MFALLPRTKSVFTPGAIAFRFESPNSAVKTLLEKDARVVAFDKNKTRWFTLELSSDADLHDALDYLARAFDAAPTLHKRK